jgi:hypothetical protein
MSSNTSSGSPPDKGAAAAHPGLEGDSVHGRSLRRHRAPVPASDSARRQEPESTRSLPVLRGRTACQPVSPTALRRQALIPPSVGLTT